MRVRPEPTVVEGTSITTINEIGLFLSPELIAAAHKKRVLDLFMVWSVAKAIDSKAQGRGVLTMESLRRIMFQVLPIKQHYTYHKIEQGIGKFWNRPGGKKGEKRIGLWSLNRILRECVIETEIPPCRPFYVTVEQLREFSDTTGQEGLRAWLLSLVRARHGGNRPVSNANYAEETGGSRSTAQRHRRVCRSLTTIQNWVCVYKAPSEPHAVYTSKRMNDEHGKGMKPYSVVRDEDANTFLVARRLPNSYIMADVEQLPFHSRSKELKNYDVRNSSQLNTQTYLRNDLNSKKLISKRSSLNQESNFTVRGYGFLIFGGETSKIRGKVCLWQSERLTRQKGESVSEYLARTVHTVDVELDETEDT